MFFQEQTLSCDHVLKHFKLKNMKCLWQKHLKNLANGEDAFVIQPTSSGLSIGPLQLAILVVQNHHAGMQKSHRDKTNIGNYHLKLCLPFVGLAPVRLLHPSIAVLYHMNGKLQKAYNYFPICNSGCWQPLYVKRSLMDFQVHCRCNFTPYFANARSMGIC